MLHQQDKDTLALISRSPDRGDGWRVVSPACWALITQFQQKGLLEIDDANRRVRLSDDGKAIAMYAL